MTYFLHSSCSRSCNQIEFLHIKAYRCLQVQECFLPLLDTFLALLLHLRLKRKMVLNQIPTETHPHPFF